MIFSHTLLISQLDSRLQEFTFLGNRRVKTGKTNYKKCNPECVKKNIYSLKFSQDNFVLQKPTIAKSMKIIRSIFSVLTIAYAPKNM